MKPRLTLKTRFTLVAAGAVAAVALAITAVAFVATARPSSVMTASVPGKVAE